MTRTSCFLWIVFCLAGGLNGDETATRDVAATVNGVSIPVAAVDQHLKQFLQDRPLAPEAVEVFRAQTLAQLVDRELILQWLAKKEQQASPADVELELQRFTQELGRRGIELDQFLEQRQLERSDLQHSMLWRLSWSRFLDRYQTDENIRRYFEDRRRQFDGTRLKVAHILLAMKEADGTRLKAKLTEARVLRQRITSGQLSFAAAARQASDAPTGENGGDIGLIERKGPMPESFTAAAFELAEGEISQPVQSPFGVHLIRCLEVLPGKKSWQDARGEVETAMKRYLFEWAAGQERRSAEIQFSAGVPHFQPGTQELAE